MKLHGAVGGVLFSFLAASLAAAGCSSSSSPGTGGGGNGDVTEIPGCNQDTTVDCSASGADGWSCPSGTDPTSVDTSVSCSDPTPDGQGNDTYCCFSWTQGDSTCTPDDDITSACPDPTSYGYRCDAAGDDPTSLDSSLTCSAAVPDANGTSSDFCCVFGGSGSSSGGSSSGGGTDSCGVDSSVDCSASTGTTGYSCPAGDSPDTGDGLSCSDPTPNGSDDDFCCLQWSSTDDSSCAPDDTVTDACPDPDSYGYKCADATDDPTSLDSSLNCSDGVADADGTSTDFCCTL